VSLRTSWRLFERGSGAWPVVLVVKEVRKEERVYFRRNRGGIMGGNFGKSTDFKDQALRRGAKGR